MFKKYSNPKDLPVPFRDWMRSNTRKRISYIHDGLGDGSNYRRRSSHWDGGSRTLYSLYRLSGSGDRLERMEWPKGSSPQGFPNFYSGEPCDLGEFAVVVETGTFMGKTMAPEFHCTDSVLLALGLKSEFSRDDK